MTDEYNPIKQNVSDVVMLTEIIRKLEERVAALEVIARRNLPLGPATPWPGQTPAAPIWNPQPYQPTWTPGITTTSTNTEYK